MGIMTNGQYARLVEAKKAGDLDLVEKIKNEPYGGEVIDVEVVDNGDVSEDELAEDIMCDIAGGVDRKEIMAKYGITTQKISAIVKKAK
jgi:hypothetical protein